MTAHALVASTAHTRATPLRLPELVPPTAVLGSDTARLRAEVRAFLASGLAAGSWRPSVDTWLSGWDPAFSVELGRHGWLGMTVPAEYGGRDASPLERFVVTEELLAAGAPVAAHWFADRQIAPSLLRFGTEQQRRRYLPGIAAGTTYFAIGMSEADSGSDLASVATRATRTTGGWLLNGTKMWTSGAHRAHAMVVLARSTPANAEDRHAGLSQFIVELNSADVSIRPIPLLTGAHHFNEVVLDGVFVPDSMMLGQPGDGWMQVSTELAFERSGPERYLSTYQLLVALVADLVDRGQDDLGTRRQLGGVVSRLWSLRQMSLAIAGALDAGDAPELAAAVVKDLGTRFENELIDTVRLVVPPAQAEPDSTFAQLSAMSTLHAPGFTLRGGTNEILRGIVARSLGVR